MNPFITMDAKNLDKRERWILAREINYQNSKQQLNQKYDLIEKELQVKNKDIDKFKVFNLHYDDSTI